MIRKRLYSHSILRQRVETNRSIRTCVAKGNGSGQTYLVRTKNQDVIFAVPAKVELIGQGVNRVTAYTIQSGQRVTVDGFKTDPYRGEVKHVLTLIDSIEEETIDDEKISVIKTTGSFVSTAKPGNDELTLTNEEGIEFSTVAESMSR